MKRVVITGLGVVSSIGTGRMAFLNALIKGKSGIKYIPELKELNFFCQIGGVPVIENSDYFSFVEKYNLMNASSTIVYACLAGIEAWADAGFHVPEDFSSPVDKDTGVIVGSASGSMDMIGNTLIPLVNAGKVKKIRSSVVEQLLFSSSSAVLSGILGTGNVSTTNSSACATGTESLLMGYDAIKNGKALRMLVGSSEGYSPYYWAFFDAVRVTAGNFNNMPEKGSRPMSETSCGLVPSAGAGMLMLEELSSAISRNAEIYAEVAGGYQNSGGQRNGGTMTAPGSKGVVECISGALQNANCNSKDVDCISGHLSSTMADVLEVQNWATALNRKNKKFPYINSLKSMMGHSLGASGAIESIAAALELKHQFIHPSINCEDVHPQIERIVDKDKIPKTCVLNQNINFIAKTSFGFGDINACIILKKYSDNGRN